LWSSGILAQSFIDLVQHLDLGQHPGVITAIGLAFADLLKSSSGFDKHVA
jgi:hypothetical protein